MSFHPLCLYTKQAHPYPQWGTPLIQNTNIEQLHALFFFHDPQYETTWKCLRVCQFFSAWWINPFSFLLAPHWRWTKSSSWVSYMNALQRRTVVHIMAWLNFGQQVSVCCGKTRPLVSCLASFNIYNNAWVTKNAQQQSFICLKTIATVGYALLQAHKLCKFPWMLSLIDNSDDTNK